MATSGTQPLATDPSISIAIETEPADEARERILDGLRRHNRDRAEPPNFQPLTVTARDTHGRLIGGLSGELGWRWLHVSLLWVDDAHRGRGIGRALLRTAEQEAARQGCGHVYLDTLEFQARPFYERDGYRTCGVLEGYPPGHRQYHLRKSLGPEAAETAPVSVECRTVCWRRLDVPGHESAELHRHAHGWRLHGTVVVMENAEPFAFDYTIECDASWRTLRAEVSTLLGTTPPSLTLERTTAGDWLANGQPRPELCECIDVDLSFTPSTNLLPIRRLSLAVGDRAPVRAAWVRLPRFGIEVLEQVYVRVDETRYRYESNNGAFKRDLVVDDAGLVVDYPGLWAAEGSPAS